MRFNKTTRIAAAVAVIGAVAAGGAAFTDTTNQPASQALGYGSTSISGGNITGISYQLSADGTDVNTVTLTSTDNLLTDNNGNPASVYLAFDNDGFATGGDANCVIQAGGNSVICTPKSTTTVVSVTSLQIAVTNGAPNGDTLG